MQVSVEVTPAAAAALRGATKRAMAPHALPDRLKKLGIKLAPMHADTKDPELAVHFYASAASEQEAAEMVKQLLELPDVQAAYVKPPDGPPA